MRRKVAAEAVEQVEFAARAGLDHFGRGEPGLVRDGKAVSFRERIDVFGCDGLAAGQRGRVGAHFRAALHAGMAADRHQAAFVATDVAAREAEVEDHRDGVAAEGVLRDAHAPNEHGVLRVAMSSANSCMSARERPDCFSSESKESSLTCCLSLSKSTV